MKFTKIITQSLRNLAQDYARDYNRPLNETIWEVCKQYKSDHGLTEQQLHRLYIDVLKTLPSVR